MEGKYNCVRKNNVFFFHYDCDWGFLFLNAAVNVLLRLKSEKVSPGATSDANLTVPISWTISYGEIESGHSFLSSVNILLISLLSALRLSFSETIVIQWLSMMMLREQKISDVFLNIFVALDSYLVDLYSKVQTIQRQKIHSAAGHWT